MLSFSSSSIGFLCFKFQVSFIQLYHTEQPTESLISKAEINAQRYYRSCMDFYSRQKSGELKKVIVDFLDQIGGWPAFEGSNAKVEYRSWNFRQVLLKIQSVLIVDVFFDWKLTVVSSTETHIQVTHSQIINCMSLFDNEI